MPTSIKCAASQPFSCLEKPSVHLNPTRSFAVSDCTSVDSDAAGALPLIHTLLDRGVAMLKARRCTS